MEQSRAYQERKRKFERDPDYILHGLLYDLAEDIYAAMEDSGYTQAELAERAGMQASAVSRFFNTHPNTTLRTLVRLLTALDMGLTYSLEPLTQQHSEQVSGELAAVDRMRSRVEHIASTPPNNAWRPRSDQKWGLERTERDGSEDEDGYSQLYAAT